MVPKPYTAEQIQDFGLYLVGFTPESVAVSTNAERFCACYGASAQAYSIIWLDIQRAELGDSQIVKPSVIHFMMTLYWLKSYQIETRMEGIFRLSRKTIRSSIWRYLSVFQALKSKKVCE